MSEEPGTIEVAHALIDCDEMRGTEIRAAKYQGPEDGENFHMPISNPQRIRLQGLLLEAKGNPSKSFVTISKNKEKLIWSVAMLRG